jgi:hypothetical protein
MREEDSSLFSCGDIVVGSTTIFFSKIFQKNLTFHKICDIIYMY